MPHDSAYWPAGGVGGGGLGRGRGVQGGQTPPPPVYGRSNTSLGSTLRWRPTTAHQTRPRLGTRASVPRRRGLAAGRRLQVPRHMVALRVRRAQRAPESHPHKVASEAKPGPLPSCAPVSDQGPSSEALCISGLAFGRRSGPSASPPPRGMWHAAALRGRTATSGGASLDYHGFPE